MLKNFKPVSLILCGSVMLLEACMPTSHLLSKGTSISQQNGK